MPATPAKRPMKSNPLETPPAKAPRPCARRGLRELPCRRAAATSAASATGSALPTSPTTQPIHPKARGAAAGLCRPAGGAAVAGEMTPRGSKSRSPSPAGLPHRSSFAFHRASLAHVDAAAPRPNGGGPDAAHARSSLGPHQPHEGFTPEDAAQEASGEIRLDLSPSAEPDERVDVVSLNSHGTEPAAQKALQKSPEVAEPDPPEDAGIFQAAESGPKPAVSHASAAFGFNSELAAGGSALIDQLAPHGHDMVRSAVAQGIGDLTSDDMRTFEDGAASSVVHPAPDQAEPESPKQAQCQACAEPDEAAPAAEDQATSQGNMVPDEAAPAVANQATSQEDVVPDEAAAAAASLATFQKHMVPDDAAPAAANQATSQEDVVPDQAAPAVATQATSQEDVAPDQAAPVAPTTPTAGVSADGVAGGVPVAPRENTIAPADTFMPPAWVEPGFMGGAQRAAAGWWTAPAVILPKDVVSSDRGAAEPSPAPAQPHAVAAPDQAPCQLAPQQPPN